MNTSDWVILGNKKGNPAIFRNIALATLPILALIAYLSLAVLVIALLVTATSLYNAYYMLKQQGYFAVSKHGFELRNNYLPSVVRQYSFKDITSVVFGQEDRKGTIILVTQLKFNTGKFEKIRQTDDYKDALREFRQLLEAKGILINGAIEEEKEAVSDNWKMTLHAPIYGLIPVLLIAFFYYYTMQEKADRKAHLLSQGQYTVATSTGLGDVSHGRYQLKYSYQVNGKSFEDVSEEYCIDKDYQTNEYYILNNNLPIDSTGGDYFLLIYATDAPNLDQIVLNHPIANLADTVGLSQRPIMASDLED